MNVTPASTAACRTPSASSSETVPQSPPSCQAPRLTTPTGRPVRPSSRCSMPASPSMRRVMSLTVEIWSDVVCPWCYIGKRRFEHALERFEHAGDVEVRFRSFELDPQAPHAPEGTNAERLAAKYGTSLEQAQAMHARVSEAAAQEGLEYHLDGARGGNTFDAHRLIHLAAAHGRQAEAKERLMHGYFTEGEPIDDPEALVRLVTEAGVDSDAARAVLAGDDYADA